MNSTTNSLVVGNSTYFTCGGGDPHQQMKLCTQLMGHGRGMCSPRHPFGNATSVLLCSCFSYAGLARPGSCADTGCGTIGPNGCSVKNSAFYMNAVFLITAEIATLATFLYAVSVVRVGVRAKVCKKNATSTTLCLVTMSTFLFFLYFMIPLLSQVVLLSYDFSLRYKVCRWVIHCYTWRVHGRPPFLHSRRRTRTRVRSAHPACGVRILVCSIQWFHRTT